MRLNAIFLHHPQWCQYLQTNKCFQFLDCRLWFLFATKRCSPERTGHNCSSLLHSTKNEFLPTQERITSWVSKSHRRRISPSLSLKRVNNALNPVTDLHSSFAPSSSPPKSMLFHSLSLLPVFWGSFPLEFERT